MKNIVLKIFVLILLLFQAGIGFLSLYTFNVIYPKVSNADGFILSKEYIFALIVISFIVSLFFVFIILIRVGKTVTVIKEVPIFSEGKSNKETKQKKLTDPEQKNLQIQNEKKRQIIAEIMKNLNAQLSLENFANQTLINISRHYDIFQAIFFVRNTKEEVFRKAGTYAYYTQEDLPEFSDGIGLTGQVAANKKLLNISNIPDKYITVLSGLGKSSPSNLLILPILNSDKSIGIIEFASFMKFDAYAEQVLSESALLIGQQLAEILAKPETVES